MRTYLNGSVKKGRVIRWPITKFNVYIAPMKFYSKQGEDGKFRQMVMQAFSAWSAASRGLLKFRVVNALYDSHINVDWKRVDRQALGHCVFNWDRDMICGAEVSIGLSDGRIHKQYDNDIEVYHTILHEIGHSIGLGHSPYQEDIMYTPHQYGVASLSANDKYSIQWLYRLQAGTSVAQLGSMHSLSGGTDLDSIIRKIDNKNMANSQFDNRVQMTTQRNLLDETSNIGDLKRYNIMLQDISLSSNINNYLRSNSNNNKKNR